MTITAAADGSALGNPGPAGWAWYVDDDHWSAGGWKHATNNQGELKAVLELFRATAHLDDDLLVLCDSQYVINCVTKWMRGWKAKGWRKGDGKPVMNLDLLKEIDAEIAGRRYRFEWVKGHANHPLNEAADARARAVSEAYQRGGTVPRGPGWPGAPGTEASDAIPVDADIISSAPDATTPPAAPTRARPAPTRADDTPPLFSLDDSSEDDADDDAFVQVTLDAADYRVLAEAARRRGGNPLELLRELIHSA